MTQMKSIVFIVTGKTPFYLSLCVNVVGVTLDPRLGTRADFPNEKMISLL